MNFVGILAGGNGTRMENTGLPKQFLTLGDKPVLIHTIERFLDVKDIAKIIVAVPFEFIQYTKKIIGKYISNNDIFVIQGGTTRNKTIIAICEYIKGITKINDNDILITHDAVRPFITSRIIKENIEHSKLYDAVDTVIPAVDTIVESKNNDTISNIPIRKYMYQGQTPQTFKINEFMKTYNTLTEDEKEMLTDGAKIYVLKSKKVKLVMGEPFNIKITTQYDLKLANLLLENRVNIK
jgi:2-C-methyl-D-erythritol 4-phosphate cytidylyltransferase